MRDGAHNMKLKSARWLKALETLKFKPKLRDFDSSFHGGCGTATLSLITGISPAKIDRNLPKHIDYWSDKRMKNFLRKHGYEVTEITVSRVTQNPHCQEEPITSRHVLLISQEIFMREATWAVIYGFQRYHNFRPEELHPMELINNPLMTVYAVSHPKWDNMPPKNYKVKYDHRKDKFVPA